MHFGEGVVLAAMMRRDGVGHIHAHFASQAASVARTVSLLTGIPYSFTAHAHDIWQDQLLIPEKLSEARFVCCCSEFGRQWLLKQTAEDYSGKVHLVYHGLDVRRFAPPNEMSIGRDRNLVLSVGRLTEQKGFPDLISAFAILRDRGLPLHLVVLGDGEQRAMLDELVKRYALEGVIEFRGRITQEHILNYYHKAWVFALPCVDTVDGNRDGIPNVLMEALATGLPVVTTNNSGQTELIRDGQEGLIVPPGDPERLADAIQQLRMNPDLWSRISSAGRDRMVRDFDSSTTIEPLVRLLEKVSTNEQGPSPSACS